ncbi:sulfatase family protein [Novipirellula artificiosorum]|uniref:Choline-sulfatase n=1 Tax=Novipirellula artificiosorum TaxID=2528016 RepID=A0A5C6E2G7_9BACT|nr:sulfatase [Novipirellula artificiosorum]TWU42694.1 Choline-sulfatase [Novipirellula artificiosorum]
MRRVTACLMVLMMTSAATAAERPNVVFAFADDWGFHSSAYGKLDPGGVNDVATTPHFDSVAEQGVLFTHAYVSAPSCTPCRSSLMSGQHFWRCGRGAILQGAIWDFSSPSYPLMLEASGYRIGHTYKVWSPGTPADAPHGGAARAFNSAGRRFNGFSQNAMKATDPNEAKQKLFDEVRQNLLSFLDRNQDDQVDGDQPFCYFFGPTNCHRKWIAGSGKQLWGIDPDAFTGKIPPYLPDVPIVREDFADYFGEILAFDSAVGVLTEELDRLGVADNTILVISGDHGFPGVSRGKCNLYDLGTRVPLAIRWPDGIEVENRVINDFVSLPDLAPTFLDAAGVAIPGSMTARSLIPLLKSKQSGTVDPSRDAVFTGRERHVAKARTGNKPYPQRAIRTDRYLLIINFEPDRWPMGTATGYGQPEGELPDFAKLRENTFAGFGDMDASPTKAWIVTHREDQPGMFEFAMGRRPRFELFDLQNDPHCMNNLADHPEHRATRDQLDERLMEELRRTGDPRVRDEVVFESSPFTD